MLVVFEGVDNAGKSTLAEAVQKKLGGHRVHCGPGQQEYAEEHLMSILAMADLTKPELRNHRVIVDRLHWSDPVYAHYRPGHVPLDLDAIDRIDARIVELGGIIVHVTAAVEELIHRFDGEYIQTHDLPNLIKKYELWSDRFASRYPHNYMAIDSSLGFGNFDDWVYDICTRAEYERDIAWDIYEQRNHT